MLQSTDIAGPHRLTPQSITEVVTETSPGNFTLGSIQENGFCVLYVGRSDRDVAKQLRSWVSQYPHYKSFVFSYASGPRTAFDKECEDFHDYGGTERLDNAGHPQRPAEIDWLCPRCDCFD